MVSHNDFPIVTWRDLRRLLAISGAYLATGVWPAGWDGWLADRLTDIFYACNRLANALSKYVRSSRGGWVERRATQMEEILGPGAAGHDFLEAARSNYRLFIEDGLGRARDFHKKGCKAEVSVEGLDYLHQGMAAGRGVILWGMLFCGSRAPKAALWHAGIPLTHLSNESHGAPSSSWADSGAAPPLYCRAANRYLHRRIVLPLDGLPGPLREAIRSLQSNSCLSVTGETTGRENLTREMLGRRIKFSTTAPVLAWKLGSELVTFYAVREARLQYRIVIEPPIEADRSLDRPRFVRAALDRYAARLSRHIVRHPADWQGWSSSERLGEPIGRQEITRGSTAL